MTDNLLIGGGLIPAFFFGGAPTPVWITPKVSFPVVENKVNIGVGGLFATVIGVNDTNLGIAYGTATFGPRDKNLTVGIGYGYAGGDWASRPTFSLSFISRVGRKGYFISETLGLSTTGQTLLARYTANQAGTVVPDISDAETTWPQSNSLA